MAETNHTFNKFTTGLEPIVIFIEGLSSNYLYVKCFVNVTKQEIQVTYPNFMLKM